MIPTVYFRSQYSRSGLIRFTIGIFIECDHIFCDPNSEEKSLEIKKKLFLDANMLLNLPFSNAGNYYKLTTYVWCAGHDLITLSTTE